MNALNRFTLHSLPVSRWRNGGGETREIISWPPRGDAALGGDFAWRASIATIDQDGDFSAFPHIDRNITLLEGHGAVLHGVKGGTHSLTRPGEPFAFAGEDPVRAILVDGSSRDFNIMTRRGAMRAEVTLSTKEILLPAKRSGVIYVMAGQWRWAGDGAPLTVREGGWWQDLFAPLALSPLSPDATVLWADIRTCRRGI
ncbi:HutD/Ves family protein [Martelella alba]|uniref:HutD family protein n=1 Tax=Martelella alba TaxID=2590451 RepID=A0ABY2SEV6_9HYPH|nr:HutD family protein [Martelella alba]TKI03390.1 HutD family protein [Martelella alba]